MKGQPVKFGDTIQLYHDLSQMFLSVTSEKVKGQNLLRLRLGGEGSDSYHLRIQPGKSLKKEGQSVGYQDKVILFNALSQSYLLFPNKIASYRMKSQAKTIQI